jgi:hypothetical protein
VWSADDLPGDLIRGRLPEVPWLSIFGPPYEELFGAEGLATAPFASVEHRAGHVWARLSESAFTEPDDAARDAIRAHLGEDAFVKGRRWPQRPGRAPEFDFSNVLLAEPDPA